MIPLPANPIRQWFDGTYQDTNIDMQFDEIDVGQLLKFIVDVRMDPQAVIKQEPVKIMLHEQSPDYPITSVQLRLSGEDGQLWIRPAGYGEKCAPDGEGSPVGMEIWQGKLRLIVFTDINSEEPQIIDLENANESCRNEPSQTDASYGVAATYLLAEGRRIFTGPMTGGLWNARGLDACRKHDNQTAYEFLIRFGDQYAQSLPDDQKTDWQTIKDQAAALLIDAKADHPAP